MWHPEFPEMKADVVVVALLRVPSNVYIIRCWMVAVQKIRGRDALFLTQNWPQVFCQKPLVLLPCLWSHGPKSTDWKLPQIAMRCRFLIGLECSGSDSTNTTIRSAQDAVLYPKHRAMKRPTWALLCIGAPAFTGNADSTCCWVDTGSWRANHKKENQGPESPHCHLGRLKQRSSWSWLTMGFPSKNPRQLSSSWSRHRLWMQESQCKLHTSWFCILRPAQRPLLTLQREIFRLGFWKALGRRKVAQSKLQNHCYNTAKRGDFKHLCTETTSKAWGFWELPHWILKKKLQKTWDC